MVLDSTPIIDPTPDEVHGIILWPWDDDRMAGPDDEAAWSTGKRSKAGNWFNEDIDAESTEDELAA